MSFEQVLKNGLKLRSIHGEDDIRHFAKLSSTCNNLIEGMDSNLLIRLHPRMTRDDFLVVEDQEEGRIVSTSCLIPWRIRYGEVELTASQHEMILTHPDYRNQGLVRIQMERLWQLILERNLDLSIIWGIPGYYRQYGFSYAVEGLVYESLPSWRVPGNRVTPRTGYSLRSAGIEDIPVLQSFYRNATSKLEVVILRDERHWRFLMEDGHFPVLMVEETDTRKVAGYIIKVIKKENGAVHIIEHAIPDPEVGMSVLRILAGAFTGEIAVFWPRGGTLATLSRSLGSVKTPDTQWLFRIPSWPAFLTKLRPVLDRRLLEGGYRKISIDLVINMFRLAICLEIREGIVDSVRSIGFRNASMGSDGGALCIPEEAFIRLLMGQADLIELFDSWPDIVVKLEHRHLIGVLFPITDAYLYTPYQYYGPLFDLE